MSIAKARTSMSYIGTLQSSYALTTLDAPNGIDIVQRNTLPFDGPIPRRLKRSTCEAHRQECGSSDKAKKCHQSPGPSVIVAARPRYYSQNKETHGNPNEEGSPGMEQDDYECKLVGDQSLVRL